MNAGPGPVSVIGFGRFGFGRSPGDPRPHGAGFFGQYDAPGAGSIRPARRDGATVRARRREPGRLAHRPRGPYHCPVPTPPLVAHAVPLPAGIEPADLLALAEAAGGPRAYWSAFDDDLAIAGIGAAHRACAVGPDRLAAVARDVAAARGRVAVRGELPADVLWLGGFAFEDGPATAAWSAFGSAWFVLPAALVVRRGGEARLTAIGRARDDEAVAARARRLAARLAEEAGANGAGQRLAAGEAIASFGSVGRRATGRVEVAADEADDRTEDVAADEALAGRLAAGVAAVARGEVDKVVVGTTRTLRLDPPPDPVRLLARMARRAPGCTRFLVAPDAGHALVGATPERLVAVAGRALRTMALAGTAPRGTDRDADEALGRALLASPKDRAEHAHVVAGIRGDLDGVALDAPAEPRLRPLATLWHLETPIAGRSAAPLDVLAAAARLHPTAALAGRPRDAALALVARLEGAPRGWFGGAVGWLDGRGDGDLAVVIRSLLVRGREVTAFAGAGLVAASDPAAEAAEIALKLRATLGPLAEDDEQPDAPAASSARSTPATPSTSSATSTSPANAARDASDTRVHAP